MCSLKFAATVNAVELGGGKTRAKRNVTAIPAAEDKPTPAASTRTRRASMMPPPPGGGSLASRRQSLAVGKRTADAAPGRAAATKTLKR